jgi:hypothetical protein
MAGDSKNVIEGVAVHVETGSWPSDRQTPQRRDAADGFRSSEELSLSTSMNNSLSGVKGSGKAESGMVVCGWNR